MGSLLYEWLFMPCRVSGVRKVVPGGGGRFFGLVKRSCTIRTRNSLGWLRLGWLKYIALH